MAAIIRQVRPVWQQLQGLDWHVPPNAGWISGLALGAAVLLMAGIVSLSTFWAPTRLWWEGAVGTGAWVPGLQASLLAAMATALGALPVFLVQRVSKRQELALMAFSAGVMLAASIFALLLPSLAAGQTLLAATVNPSTGAAALSAIGLLMGMGLMIAIDRRLPHEHAVLPPAAAGHTQAWQTRGESAEATRAWLMVLAILIHNVPEGLAVGAAYADGADMSNSASVALAIGLQNMPEGLIVAMALRSLGRSAFTAWGVAALTGLAEPLGAILGLWALGSVPSLYPIGLALAAGAMLFVISHEIIPETHRDGFEGMASITLMGGFIFMLMLDAALA